MTAALIPRGKEHQLLGDWSCGDEGALRSCFRWCNPNCAGWPTIT